jgi:hypothetical protein
VQYLVIVKPDGQILHVSRSRITAAIPADAQFFALLAIGQIVVSLARLGVGEILSLVFKKAADEVAESAPILIEPLNGEVNVGGGGEMRNVTNLNPIKPGSGGPTKDIPNHVLGGMEDMDQLFVRGSVKKMWSQRLRYIDVDWAKGTQAAADVMPSGGQVWMNIWTQTQEEVNALKAAFERAGCGNVTAEGIGPGTMLRAVRL